MCFLKMMKKKMKTKIGVIVILGASLWCSVIINKKYNKIDEKLDYLTKNIITHELEEIICEQDLYIDSLLMEIMDLGWKNDSLTLKYKHNWKF